MSEITLNHEQRLFVLPCGNGFTCLGFDVAFKRLAQYAGFLNRPAPKQEEIGTLAQYEQYRETEQALAAARPSFTIYDPETPEAVQRVLNLSMCNDARLRLYCGDTTTGRSWLEEYDTIGRVSRTMGPLKSPLLLVNRRSHGGGIILSGAIIGIQNAQTKAWLYRHPKFHVPELTARDSEMEGFETEVLVESKVHARFKTRARADAWMQFMRGERMRAY